ncbi:NAD(P)-dependent oxidoreductase [Chitinophaga horti]|uniref:NAD(P)-dependent oxidoreductase n=1 Tax=Chitinophaga horti TaxID=2920382 RepID=A0ABY6JAB8_9BACT|nr:NAD(P)-dependent oxidoreductase [Chitinophaga horti]UYQ95124.1 NAD(P)-dependent oxidoreductase [Chitinophaga horti]
MKIALIGATGFVGTQVLNELLNRGHEVTAVARNTSKLEAKSNLTVRQADIFDIDATASVLAGNDLVLSAYNPGWTNPNIEQEFIKGSEAIQAATKKAGVKRFIVVGGAGSLYVGDQQLIDTPNFPKEYYNGANGARKYLDILKGESTLDWTFFSPAIEMHQGITTGRTGKYRTGTENPVFDENGRSILSVEDLAIVLADEVEQPKFIKARFTAAY